MTGDAWTMEERVEAVLLGKVPDRLPFVDRLELWHAAHAAAHSMPADLDGLSGPELYQAVGMGAQRFVVPYTLRLRGVEVVAWFEGEEIYRDTDPEFESFPGMWDVVPKDRPGTTRVSLRTSAGEVSVEHQLLSSMIASGTDPYLREHMIKDEADYRTVEYILERAEYVPHFERIIDERARFGSIGCVAPLLHRIPFQQVLLEYLGEVPLFYALHDSPRQVGRLLELLDQQLTAILRELADIPSLYVEFPDNLHGDMTNPKLFERYCLPAYQRYTEILHGLGKKVGSHTDGNVRPLLGLLAESGLDVCESISPSPLTEATFEEIWNSWRKGPIIWGGIPSPILEVERTSERDFEAYVQRLFELVGGGPIILGVGDLVVGNNSIDRVRYIAKQVEEHAL